jgi:hypothetical protein
MFVTRSRTPYEVDFKSPAGPTGAHPASRRRIAQAPQDRPHRHFFTHRELIPAESSAMCYIRVSDVESIHRAFTLAELPRKGIPRMDALEDKPWGLREFAIVDSDGNLLRIGQKL